MATYGSIVYELRMPILPLADLYQSAPPYSCRECAECAIRKHLSERLPSEEPGVLSRGSSNWIRRDQ